MTPWIWFVGCAVLVVATAWYAARLARNSAHRESMGRIRQLERSSRDSSDEAAHLAQLLDQTFEVVNIGLLHIDEVRRVRVANPTGRQWFGIEPGATPTLMAVAGSAELRDAVDRALADSALSGAEARVPIRQNVYRVQVMPLTDGGALLALRDDTALENLSRAQRELVDAFSHDLRTPLASIRLLADNLAGELGDDESTRRALTHRLDEQIEALTQMADGLLDLSRLESGRVLLRMKRERLADLARLSVQSLAPQLEESRLSVTAAIDDDVYVLADEQQVIRVFRNLLDNALSFSPPDASVQVGAAYAGDEMVEVYVTDDGPGISPVDADRVFERFYRGDRARSGDGKGLGLAIARQIVVGHGGAVWVEPGVTKGATIRFTLPAARES